MFIVVWILVPDVAISRTHSLSYEISYMLSQIILKADETFNDSGVRKSQNII